MLPFKEAMGEINHKQQNLILSSRQFRKIIYIHYVALLLDLATHYSSNSFQCAAS